MVSHGVRLVLAVLFLVLCMAASRSALASNPTVPQGGSASFSYTGHDAPPLGMTWSVVRSGVTYGTSSTPNGWNVTWANPNLTVTAPASATVQTGYECRYYSSTGQSIGQSYSAFFDVIAKPAVSSLTVNPTSVIGGVTNSTGTVTLGSAAPTGGIAVSLSSNNTSAASVPSSVTVAAGATTATFMATSHTVSSAVNVTLTATYNGSATATLRVVPQPSLSSLSLLPAGVTGGSSSTGTVTLSSEAPSGGISVGLSSNNSAASVTSPVTVAAGATSATFTVNTTAVVNAVSATITASYNSGSQTATLNIYPPQLQSFTLNPSPSISGGQDVTATITLDGPAPTGGASVSLSCSNNSAASVPSASPTSLPTSVLIPAGNTSLSFTIHTSTVNYAMTITFTATYNAQMSATLTLTQANLWVTAIYPSTLNLAWNASASGSFQLTRFVLTPPSTWTQQMSVTLQNTQKTYVDSFAFTSGQTYLYQLSDTSSSLLAQEQVVPYQSNTTEDQTVDSRQDPRYSTVKYLDFQFGSGIYRGGLFVGYQYSGGAPTDNPPPDSSRIARSFAKFPLSAYPSNGNMRTGGIDAYLTGCNTDEGSASVTVGCQALSTNSWVGSTLTWDTAPSVTLSSASPTVPVSSTDSPATHWCYWPMPDTIKSTLTGSQLLSVAWASTHESQTGWAYFAKQEYDPTLAPCAAYVYELPVPVSLTFSPNPAPRPSTVTGYVTVNGLGPGDPPVTVTIQPGNLTVTVSGLSNPGTFTLSIPSLWSSTQFFASCNNATVSAWLY